MKRVLLVLCTPLLILMATVSPAYADSPHFVRASASLSGSNLVVSFKEAELGANQLVNYVANADATATYVCVNRGGGNPSASNKTTVSGPVSATGTFSSGKSGQVTASLTLTPPGPGNFSCPPGLLRSRVTPDYGLDEVGRTSVGASSGAGDVRVAVAAVVPDRRVAERGEHGGPVAGPGLVSVFT
jgi:hypothetical protein